MDTFDEETKSLINQIHRAWKSKASLPEYAIIRDRITDHRDRLDVQITALSAVVRLVAQRSILSETSEDQAWREFFALAATLQSEVDEDDNDPASLPSLTTKKKSRNEVSRSRNLAVIVALWSAEVVQYYGWDRAGQGQIRIIRLCAVQFPDFEADLGPHLNSVLLARHCVAIQHSVGRTLNESRLQPHKDLNVATLCSATIDKQWEHEWITNEDGLVRVDSSGTLLKDVRPDHFRLYLLQRDRYGVLQPRELLHVSPTDISLVDPPAAALESLWPPGWLDESIRSPPTRRIADDSTSSIPLDLYSAVSTAGFGSANIQPSSTLVGDLYLEDIYPLESDAFSDRPYVSSISPDDLHDGDLALLSNPGGPTTEQERWCTQQFALDRHYVLPTSDILERDWGSYDALWIPESTVSSSVGCSVEPEVSRLQIQETDTSTLEITTATVDVRIAKDRLRKKSSHIDVRAGKRARRSCHSKCTQFGDNSEAYKDLNDEYTGGTEARHPLLGAAETIHAITNPRSGLKHGSLSLQISAPCVDNADMLTLEEQLHNKHRSDIANFLEKLANTSNGGQTSGGAQWLTPRTSWATIWSSSKNLGRGRASYEDEADVLYYDAVDFVSHAKAGKTFRKPIVVKENFSDQGMHTIAQFLILLQDSGSRPVVNGRVLGSKERLQLSSDRFAHLAWSTPDIQDDLKVSIFRNLTKSHRPTFTMLPRYRLLETLTEELHWCPGDAIEPSPVDFRACVGFNVLSQPGAFSGIRVNALYGSWIRNLEGIKYWMFVPEAEMVMQWDAFASQGDEWLPGGRERLIVLEEDDILLMPPGSRIVHAVHSPTCCLMEGGILWDTFNIPEILRSILWACENNLTNNEAISIQLPRAIQNLEQLVHAQTDRFRGNHDSTEFLKDVDGAIRDLQDLGYRCAPSLEDAVRVQQSEQGCDAWSLDHTELLSYERMTEKTQL